MIEMNHFRKPMRGIYIPIFGKVLIHLNFAKTGIWAKSDERGGEYYIFMLKYIKQDKHKVIEFTFLPFLITIGVI